MSQPTEPPELFAAIDLGSNSFHMLVVRKIAGCVQIMAKIKRKVRLASGLDENGVLSQAAMLRGWQCLALFSERLQGIPAENVRVVGTATLRLASNAESFLLKAESIINHHIEVISGEDEARIIYQGVAHTASGGQRRLVIDIGGASTELIIGEGYEAREANSLNLGCVVYRERYFSDGLLNTDNFIAAEQAAMQDLAASIPRYRQLGWDACMGASGTVQAVQEVLLAQGKDERITLKRMESLREQLIECGRFDNLDILGLINERKPVFPSGLVILIALFKALGIKEMTTSGGALREGLVYEMLGNLRRQDVRDRTLSSLLMRYHLDQEQGKRTRKLAGELFDQVAESWKLNAHQAREILLSAAQVHELGLIIGFVDAHRHAAYILKHSPLPGFTPVQKRLLTLLVGNSQGPLHLDEINRMVGFSRRQTASLIRLLRLAILLTAQRMDMQTDTISLSAKGEQLRLTLPSYWREHHPLSEADLETERLAQQVAGWELLIETAAE